MAIVRRETPRDQHDAPVQPPSDGRRAAVVTVCQSAFSGACQAQRQFVLEYPADRIFFCEPPALDESGMELTLYDAAWRWRDDVVGDAGTALTEADREVMRRVPNGWTARRLRAAESDLPETPTDWRRLSWMLPVRLRTVDDIAELLHPDHPRPLSTRERGAIMADSEQLLAEWLDEQAEMCATGAWDDAGDWETAWLAGAGEWVGGDAAGRPVKRIDMREWRPRGRDDRRFPEELRARPQRLPYISKSRRQA